MRTTPDGDTMDLLEAAWVLIANVSGGDWEKETAEWQDAAKRWRTRYHEALDAHGEEEGKIILEEDIPTWLSGDNSGGPRRCPVCGSVGTGYGMPAHIKDSHEEEA